MSNTNQAKRNRLTVFGVSNIPMWGMGHKGGMPSVYWSQKGFVLEGHDVHLLVPSEVPRDQTEDEGIHIHYFTVPFRRLDAKNIWLHRVSVKIYWCAFLFFAARAAMKIAKEIKPDIVYGHTSYGAPVAWLIAKRFGVPNITRLYGTFLFPILNNTIRLIGKCEEVIAFKIPSSYLIVTDDGTYGNRVAKHLKVPDEKVIFWRNGVNRYLNPRFDIDELKLSLGLRADQRLVLTASRLAEWKKVDRLINAIPEVVSEMPDVMFVILGDGPEKAKLINLAETLGVTQYLNFKGDVSQEIVAKYMNAADVFVSLFDLSNVSNAVQEAMACGKCVLALNSGDTSTLVEHKQTGMLLELNQIPQLPAILKSLLKDENLRRQLGDNASKFANVHMPVWEVRAQNEVKLVEGLVQRGNLRIVTSG